ncbi:MAG: LysM peptidoglycan-binding domain-containing protein [Gammaproteobacteria bacterium]|nr:LysM peptidoglycan-binding domain-containing protein [Gammaproteobacteria bacterium]
MTIKYFCFFCLTLFFVHGCALNNTSVNNSSSAESNEHTLESDYLTDIDAQDSRAVAAADPILKSTLQILESSPPVTQASVDEQMNDYLADNTKSEFKDIWLRLADMYQLSDVNNKRIQRQEKWLLKHKKHLKDVSRRASPFLYFITEEVNKRNMPGEIALLPVIESSFKTNVHSSMKAAGLWQFMPATGRSFGLKQNWWYDGRQDVYHSTLAALTYLEQLNKYYKGDWLLALAAYNAGAGNINKAIKKNRKEGKAVDYWSLSLPKETYNYVPKLLAVSRIIQKYQTHGISLSPIENSPRLMLVDIQSQIDLSIVAKMADISVAEIRSYNPAFKQWATNPDGPHHLFIPIDKVNSFEQQLALLDDNDRVKWYRHKIRSGESLSVIAHRYKISIGVLKTANQLKNSRIRAGKYLLVPSGGSNLAAYQQPVITSSMPTSKNTYKVRKGDSFWKIARRFDMSHQTLASLNGLSSGDTLSIGQKLLISKQTVMKKTPPIETQAIERQAINYKVKSGDSLYKISKQFKVTINDLKHWNRLTLKKYLKPGQELKVFTITSSNPI